MFNLNFSIVIFSETWVDDNKLVNDSLSQLSGYNISHQLRKNQRGEKKAYLYMGHCPSKRDWVW